MPPFIASRVCIVSSVSFLYPDRILSALIVSSQFWPSLPGVHSGDDDIEEAEDVEEELEPEDDEMKTLRLNPEEEPVLPDILQSIAVASDQELSPQSLDQKAVRRYYRRWWVSRRQELRVLLDISSGSVAGIGFQSKCGYSDCELDQLRRVPISLCLAMVHYAVQVTYL